MTKEQLMQACEFDKEAGEIIASLDGLEFSERIARDLILIEMDEFRKAFEALVDAHLKLREALEQYHKPHCNWHSMRLLNRERVRDKCDCAFGEALAADDEQLAKLIKGDV